MSLILLKILLILICIVIFVRLGFDVGKSLFICTIILGLLFGINYVEIFYVFLDSILDFPNIELYLIVLSITFLGSLMHHFEKMNEIVDSLENYFGDLRFVVSSAPAFIGMLPMPGGAMMSAPLVKSINERLKLDSVDSTVINYWFRHIWEYFWPIYPAIILTSALVGIPLINIVIVNLIFAVFAVFIGWFMLLRKLVPVKGTRNAGNFKGFLFSSWPMLIVIFGHIFLKINLVAISGFSILCFGLVHKIDYKVFVHCFRLSKPVSLGILIFGVMTFKKMLETTHVVELLPQVFNEYKLPPLFVLVIIPYLVGLLTGLTIAAIGVGIPVLLALIKTELGVNYSLLMVSYISGYLGVLSSPVHLCLVLTRDYFNADWNRTYKKVLFLVGLMFSFLFCLFYAGYPFGLF